MRSGGTPSGPEPPSRALRVTMLPGSTKASIAVHEELSEQIVDAQDASGKQREGRAKKAFAAGRLSGREEARIASVLKDAERAYRDFAKAKPFRS
jgi:hypothetical protein